MTRLFRICMAVSVFAVSALLATGCGDDDGDNGDTTPPSVVSTFPVDGAEQVPLNASVMITMSENIDVNSVDSAQFEITPAIDGLFTYVDKQFTFTPDVDFDPATQYTVTLKAGIQDASGNVMTSDYQFSFTSFDPTFSWTQVILDPNESLERDIASVWARHTDSTLDIRVVTHEPWDTIYSENNGISAVVYFDIDQNRATGDTSTTLFKKDGTPVEEIQLNDIGADYRVLVGFFGVLGQEAAHVERWAGPGTNKIWVDQTDAFTGGNLSNDTTTFELYIRRSKIGSPTGAINILAANAHLTFDPPMLDWAPNQGQGHGTYDLSTPPASPGHQTTQLPVVPKQISNTELRVFE